MSLEFLPHDRITARVDHIGAERAPVIIIDNVAADPQALIDHAAALAPFSPAERSFYPGVTAPVPMPFVQAVHAYFDSALRQTFGLGDQTVTSGAWYLSLVTTPPSALGLRQRMPHIDSTHPGNLALLLYLCSGDQGGTGFYRHRRTGFQAITEDRFDAYEGTLKAELAAGGAPSGYINGDSEIFERIADYAPVFNRMLIYRGNGLHSANIGRDFGFDPDPRTGRLTLNLFLHFRRPGPTPARGTEG
jgi:hypothetical protein